MAVVVSADALQVSRLMLDTPAHEADRAWLDDVPAVVSALSKGSTKWRALTEWITTVHIAWSALGRLDCLA